MHFEAEIRKNGKKIFAESGEKEVEEILKGLDYAVRKEIGRN